MDKNQRKEKIKEDIFNYLEQGMFEKDAAELSGIDRTTMWRWKEEDATFATRVEASIVKYKRKLIHIINMGCVKNPSIALKILRIRWPEEWGVKKKIKQEESDKPSLRELPINRKNPHTSWVNHY